MKIIFTLIFLCLIFSVHGQEIPATTKVFASTALPDSVSKSTQRLKLSGYMQPQFQVASQKGIESFSGGAFSAHSNNRFMLRRARVKLEYVAIDQKDFSTEFVFQLDATEDDGVEIKDVFGRIAENKLRSFSLTAGVFSVPFGYEIDLSSSRRESPERGRMSQTIFSSERDVGAMLSFAPENENHHLKILKIDVGYFNGQGISAGSDHDSHKDFIARAGLQPFYLWKNISFSFDASYYNGGILQSNKYVARMNKSLKSFEIDSSLNNTGKIASRNYYGADAQIKAKNNWGFFQLRGEIIKGTQPSFAFTSETPERLPSPDQPIYKRRFSGGYFYFLQNLLNEKNMIAVKFDYYDPNTDVSGADIGAAGKMLTAADISYSTLGVGFIRHLNEHAKLTLWYDKVWNEKTSMQGYQKDLDDDVLTCRLQFYF